MLEKLEETHLQVITLSKTDFTWIKKEKEIKWGNNLFDVKEWKEVNGQFIFRGIYDDDEKQLNTRLCDMMKNSKQESSSQNIFAKVFTQLTCINNHFNWQLTPFSTAISKHFTIYRVNIPEITIPVFTPPPQV